MSSRNIAITQDLYDLLSRKKKGSESFTKVIYRLIEENDRPSKYVGEWADLTEDEEKSIAEAREELREQWTERGG